MLLPKSQISAPLVSDLSQLARLLLESPQADYKNLANRIYPLPHYNTFSIPKKLGGERVIEAPSPGLKRIQRNIKRLIEEIFPYSEIRSPVHGFVKDRSIVSGASQHVGRQFILNIDLKDFFGSIHYSRVRGLFEKHPFNLPRNVAQVLAHCCCLQGRLPQGAPTSPVVSNLICRKLDFDLLRLSRRYGAEYTRYADDLTFSFDVESTGKLPRPIVEVTKDSIQVGAALIKIINAHSFEINSNKTRLCTKGGRLEVTGLTVNEFPNVRRDYVHQIRGMLHSLEKYGSDAATQHLNIKTKSTSRIEDVLWGKLLFLKMVREYADVSSIYSRLAARYNSLPSATRKLPISNIVTVASDFSQAVFTIECTGENYLSEADDEKVDYKQGTAFLLDGIGLITCDHVVRLNSDKEKLFANSQIEVKDDNMNVVCRVELIAHDQATDIAVFKPVNIATTFSWFRPMEKSELGVGDDAILLGFPDYSPSASLSKFESKITSLFKMHGADHFEIGTQIRAGNSGGPVLNNKCEVIGVAKEGALQNRGKNAVVSISEILKLLLKSSYEGAKSISV